MLKQTLLQCCELAVKNLHEGELAVVGGDFNMTNCNDPRSVLPGAWRIWHPTGPDLIATFAIKPYERRVTACTSESSLEEFKIQNHTPVCGAWFHEPDEQRPRLVPDEGKQARARHVSKGLALTATSARLRQEVDQLLDGIVDASASDVGVVASRADVGAAASDVGVAASPADAGVAASDVGAAASDAGAAASDVGAAASRASVASDAGAAASRASTDATPSPGGAGDVGDSTLDDAKDKVST